MNMQTSAKQTVLEDNELDEIDSSDEININDLSVPSETTNTAGDITTENIDSSTNTSETLNSSSVEEQVQHFDNTESYDINILNTDLNEDVVENDIHSGEIKNDIQNDMMADDELSSALKELDGINLELSEEKNTLDNNTQSNTENINMSIGGANMSDLKQNSEKSIQNDIENFGNDLNNPLGVDDLDVMPVENNNTTEEVNNDSGFDIKESIEKLKAQLEENKNDNK